MEGVIHTVSMPQRGRTKLLCELKDEVGVIYLRFFHVLSFQTNILKMGTRLRCYGVPYHSSKKVGDDTSRVSGYVREQANPGRSTFHLYLSCN